MSKTARKSGETELILGFASGRVTFHKVTTDGGRAARWDTRRVDAEGNPVEEEAQPLSLAVPEQGDPLGLEEESVTPGLMAPTAPPDEEEAEPGSRVQRGFETKAGFVPADAQLEAIDTYAKLDAMKVVGFVSLEGIPRSRQVGAYYLAPADDTTGAAARHVMEVLREALRRKRRVAVVKWTKKTRQSLGVIAPMAGGLGVIELAWGENVQTMPKTGILNGDLATEGEIRAGMDLIDAMAEPRASMDELRDDAVVLRQQLRALAEDGRLEDFVVPSTPEEKAEVVSLEDAFDDSIAHAEEFRAVA